MNYRVPPEKLNDLGRDDGSVVVARTNGEISARCDKDGANFQRLVVGAPRTIVRSSTAGGNGLRNGGACTTGLPGYSLSNPWLVNFNVRLFSVTVRTI